MGGFWGSTIAGIMLAAKVADSTDASADSGTEVGAGDLPDIEIEGDTCCFNTPIEDIRKKARQLLNAGAKWGFGEFPIKLGAFKGSIIKTHVTEKNICNALLSSPDVDESNHDKTRKYLSGHSVGEGKAWKMGMKAARIQVKENCPEDYDWANSPVYIGVESCEDVWDEIDSHGVPVVMYSVDMESAAARTFIDKPSTAILYTDYGKGEPKQCGSGKQGGRAYEDSFHAIPVIGKISIDFIIRVFTGKRWSAWNQRDACGGHSADDLKFDFGMRVFVPVTVDDGYGPEDRTLVITSVAAASNLVIADALPSDLPYKRFVGGELAKKVLMDAKGKGWPIN